MKNEKQYIIALAPAVVCTLIAFAYILQAPEGLRLPAMIANIIQLSQQLSSRQYLLKNANRTNNINFTDIYPIGLMKTQM